MFQGLNAFLMHHGCDVAGLLPELHAAASPTVNRVLASPRDARLAEAVHTYLRIQLELGTMKVGISMRAFRLLDRMICQKH